jgi:hypothetical protein
MTPPCGTDGRRGCSVGMSPSSTDRRGLPVGEGEHHSSGTPFLSFWFFSFFSLYSLYCMTGLSLGAIKGKVQYLSRGRLNRPIAIPRTGKTHSQPQPTETWELIPLSIVCNPYYELSASNTDTSSPTSPATSLTPAGPITRNRAKKIQQEVHALLYEFQLNTNENFMLPKSCVLTLLRYTRENKQNTSGAN